MKQKIFSSLKSFAIIFSTIALLFYFCGCASVPSFTRTAYNYAKEKGSTDYDYRHIKNIVSATKQENGDISVCVELETRHETEQHKLSTITLPLSALTGETTFIEKLELLDGGCPYDDMLCYWYPIEKSKNGCEKITPESLTSTSVIPIEKLEVPNRDRNRLYKILDSNNKNQQITEQIYEVSFVFDEEKAEKNTKDKSLIYWPAQIERQIGQPVNIAGVYTDNSTDLYYLTVPAAAVGDAIAYTVATLFLIGAAGSSPDGARLAYDVVAHFND